MDGHTASAAAAGSLYEDAAGEAQRHRWVESEKQGRDLGERAVREWYQRYWPRFCRKKRLEHVLGQRRWREFGETTFARLDLREVTSDVLVDRIVDRVESGCENLELLLWSAEWGLNVEHVIEILEEIDVNSTRIEPVAA